MCGAGHDKSLPLRCVWQFATHAPCLVGTGCWRFAFGASPYGETRPSSGSPYKDTPSCLGTTLAAACADNTKHAPLSRQTRLHSRTPCPLPHIAKYTFGIFSGTRKHTKREVQPWRKNGLRTFFHARQRDYRTFRSGESGFFGARVQHIGGSTEGVVKGHP